MDATEFLSRLEQLDAAEIGRVAAAIRHEVDTAEGEVTWWRATVAVSCSLRVQRRTRQAGMAAHDAAATVLAAATRTGLLEVDHDAATMVARAAADVSRALLAGPAMDHELGALLAPFNPIVLAAVEPA